MRGREREASALDLIAVFLLACFLALFLLLGATPSMERTRKKHCQRGKRESSGRAIQVSRVDQISWQKQDPARPEKPGFVAGTGGECRVRGRGMKVSWQKQGRGAQSLWRGGPDFVAEAGEGECRLVAS